MSMANTLTGAQLDALWDATWAAREARERHMACDMCSEEIAGTAYILPQWMGGDVLCEACADDPDTLLYYFGRLDVGSMQAALELEAKEI